MPPWIKLVAAVVGVAGLIAVMSFAMWAEFDRSGRIPVLLGILVALIYWAVRRRNSAAPRFRRTTSDQKKWLREDRWRR